MTLKQRIAEMAEKHLADKEQTSPWETVGIAPSNLVTLCRQLLAQERVVEASRYYLKADTLVGQAVARSEMDDALAELDRLAKRGSR